MEKEVLASQDGNNFASDMCHSAKAGVRSSDSWSHDHLIRNSNWYPVTNSQVTSHPLRQIDKCHLYQEHWLLMLFSPFHSVLMYNFQISIPAHDFYEDFYLNSKKKTTIYRVIPFEISMLMVLGVFNEKILSSLQFFFKGRFILSLQKWH